MKYSLIHYSLEVFFFKSLVLYSRSSCNKSYILQDYTVQGIRKDNLIGEGQGKRDPEPEWVPLLMAPVQPKFDACGLQFIYSNNFFKNP